MVIYIYQKDVLIAGVPAPSLEEFNYNPNKFYPPMPEGLFVASELFYEFPIIEGNSVRSKTREERIILDNEIGLLLDGEYIENSAIKFKECPDNLYIPEWVSPNWIEGISLEDAKEKKRVELKNNRDIEIYAHYFYSENNHIYDADLDSRNRLFQAQQLGVGTSSTIEWITADNKISIISNLDLVNIVNGIAYREQQLFNKFSEKYQQVLDCGSVDSVKNINW